MGAITEIEQFVIDRVREMRLTREFEQKEIPYLRKLFP